MNRVSSVSLNNHSFFQKIWTSSYDLLQRVKSAVLAFFKWIAEKIYSGYTKLTCFFKKGEQVESETQKDFSPVPLDPKMKEKLAPYQNLPQDPAQFMKRSIELYRQFLEKKDLRLAQKLRETVGDMNDIQIPDDQKPNQLKTFNEEFRDLEAGAFSIVLLACIRAYVFSNSNAKFNFFEKTVRSEKVSYLEELSQLQKRYMALTNQEKELLLENDVPDQLTLSKNAKYLFQEIAKIQTELVQGNKAFNEVVGEAYALFQ